MTSLRLAVKKSLQPEKLAFFNTYFKIPSLGLQVRDHMLPGMWSCVETGTFKRTIWPVGFLLRGCVSKHAALQGARTKLFPAESFLRLTSSNKVSAVLQRQTRQNGDDHSSTPARCQGREMRSWRFCKSRTFLISHSPGS